MPTLMRYNHPKLGLRKCDSGCYNATEPKCDCICSGKNHGVGYQNARSYTTLNAHSMIREYEEKLKAMLDLLT